jgi:hypothetical protein
MTAARSIARWSKRRAMVAPATVQQAGQEAPGPKPSSPERRSCPS